MDQKKEEILENHGKNLPHGQSIGDRPLDHHDLPPMMTKAQLANKADIKDLGEGHFTVTGNFLFHILDAGIFRTPRTVRVGTVNVNRLF